MMLNSKTIGNKIAQARKNSNLSQAELAQQVAISAQAVGKWERGESQPDISTLNRLAEILGVDLNYFSDTFQSNLSETNHSASASNHAIENGAAPTQTNKLNMSWNMSQGNWTDADFSGLKNLEEKFSSSNIKNCKFIGSNLSDLLLKNNNIDTCDFTDTSFNNSQIQSSNLGNNSYKNCSFQGTEFHKNNINACDFSEADFTKTIFRANNFMKNRLTNAIWQNTSFIEMQVRDVVFEGTFDSCIFENCAFYGVQFEHATLTNTFFKNNKNLKRIQFIDCKTDSITYAFLKNGKADLSGLTVLE